MWRYKYRYSYLFRYMEGAIAFDEEPIIIEFGRKSKDVDGWIFFTDLDSPDVVNIYAKS